MTPERWQQIDRIFQHALDLGPSERTAFLDEACSGDQALREEVDSLITADEQQDQLVDSPALEVAAVLLASRQAELFPGQELGPYKILWQLGRGGMGEVYLAEDNRLARKVALKLLPAEFTRFEERVRRFRQEARAASALNHPNIITIYEIGELDGQHFIATEFVEGETLRQSAKHKRLSILEALDITAQAGGALAAAHSAGIIHRDIKPENIMLRHDGYVKVLDFGLAKLTEPPSLAIDKQESTIDEVDTAPGILMGTVRYMSPEQARGLAVDARSDIFSLGVVMYEILAGRSPFEGNTPSDLVAEILKVDPQPLNRYLPDAPNELQEIADKALCKTREERYQSVGDMLNDVMALRWELEYAGRVERPAQGASRRADNPRSGPQAAIGTSGVHAATTSHSPATLTASSVGIILAELKRHKLSAAVTLTLILASVAGAGYLISRLRSQSREQASSRNLTVRPITTSGKAADAAISPDGRYVAYQSQEPGQSGGLWIKQVATKSNMQIVAPGEGLYGGLAFSPDGNYLYCFGQARDDSEPAIYEIPALGGIPKKLVGGVENSNGRNRISVSPDGQRLLFTREFPTGETAVFATNADGSAEQKLASRSTGARAFFGSAAWSPDGKRIACVGGKGDGTRVHGDIVEIGANGGTERPLTDQAWSWISDVVWLSDGSGLLVIGSREGASEQIWRLSYPDGRARRITTDLNGYSGLSVTADSSVVVTTQFQTVQNLWVQPNAEPNGVKQITSGTGTRDGWDGIGWTPDGKIVYSSNISGDPDIWIMDADGSNQRQLTQGMGSNDFGLSVSPDGRWVAFMSNRGGIWRVGTDGGNLKQLTDRGRLGMFSPDSRWVFYEIKEDWWEAPTEGGDAVQLTGAYSNMIPNGISPDGTLVALRPPEGQNETNRVIIYSSHTGAPVKVFDLAKDAVPFRRQWTPDGQGITYMVKRDGASNLWNQRIDGAPPRRLTDFNSHLIPCFAWSPDGKQLAIARALSTNDIVLLSNLR